MGKKTYIGFADGYDIDKAVEAAIQRAYEDMEPYPDFMLTAKLEDVTIESGGFAGVLRTRVSISTEVSGKEEAKIASEEAELVRPNLIHSVGTVEAHILKRNPPYLSVIVVGQVNSTGWTKPQILPRHRCLNDKGYMEFDFVAQPPTGRVLYVMRRIDGDTIWTGYGNVSVELKGIQVHSKTNSVELPSNKFS